MFRRCLPKAFSRSYSTRLPKTIAELLESPSDPSQSTSQVHGWVKSVRRQKKIAFAEITDGTTHRSLQAVFLDPQLAKSLTTGTSVRITGKLQESPGSGQDYELAVSSLDVLGECDAEKYPIQKKDHSVEFLREMAHLRPRTEAIASMLRLRSDVSSAFHDYFRSNGFVQVHTPIMTSSDCEGGGEVFQITPADGEAGPESHFFNKPAYLTVSSQLHLEAIAASISRVFTLSPVFRAERSLTSRHLSEFWMLEAEMAWCTELEDVMSTVESSIKHVLNSVKWKPEADAMDVRSEPWRRMTYSEAVEVLKEHQDRTGEFEWAVQWGDALKSEHEKWLAGVYVGGPVFVTDYPRELKPFYMRLNDTSKGPGGRETVACFDLLFPKIGELAGGSLREERLQHLENAITSHGMNIEDYQWYLDLRRYGTTPHGGYGLGFERLISWVGGWESVRECVAVPRWKGRMLL